MCEFYLSLTDRECFSFQISHSKELFPSKNPLNRGFYLLSKILLFETRRHNYLNKFDKQIIKKVPQHMC